MWSLGVVLYICLCGFPPFSDELCTPDNPYTLSQQIKAARFDYPSPYWDAVGDPALDLIDRMLTVDPARRASVDECLEHPWVTRRPFDARALAGGGAADPAAAGGAGGGGGVGLGDSTESLAGAMGRLDFAKRKTRRERTLLSALNDVKVSMVVGADGTPVAGGADGPAAAEQRAGATAVKVFEKNARAARQMDGGPPGAAAKNGKGKMEAPRKGAGRKEEGGKCKGDGDGREEAEEEKATEERPADQRQTKEFMAMGGKGDQPLYGYDGESRYP